ncbi:hypothetical protein [Psychromonas sp. SR45-3]|uniref:hypothetical protein n=1 Tax=Psychromonas sp. SR45-3 TaxID=2760930 RepID=UPI0015FBDF39|nr:hypothetical protein [Psychromonas sp. SR45-3]MBB1274594.1 hypothetical protein [Psychromonas sp. SR45-3]
MRNWIKTLLFVSSFSPTLLALAYVRYNIGGFDTEVFQLIIISILGTALPLLILAKVTSSTEALRFECKKIESSDLYLLAFVASYTAPIIMRAVELDLTIISALTLILVAVLWVMASIPSHPILYLFKYRFYKVESDSGVVFTLLTRRELKDPKNIKLVKPISHSMLMEKL